MDQFIQANKKMEAVKALVKRSIWTGVSMMENGKMIRNMVMDFSNILIELNIMDSGKTMSVKATAPIIILMVIDMKESGIEIFKTE